MKLVAAIIQEEDAGGLVEELVDHGHGITRIDTAGAFLHARNQTILTGVEDAQLPDVLGILERNCHTRTRLLTIVPSSWNMDGAMYLPEPIEVQVGGAIVFILEVEQFVHL